MKEKAWYTNHYLYPGLMLITIFAMWICVYLIEGADQWPSPILLPFSLILLILLFLMVYFDKELSDNLLARFPLVKDVFDSILARFGKKENKNKEEK